MDFKSIILWLAIAAFIIVVLSTGYETMTGNISPNNPLHQQVPIEKNQTGSSKSFLNDSAFSDVIIYSNDDSQFYDQTIGNQTGLYKCLKDPKCKHTVEFGVTGQCFCFTQ